MTLAARALGFGFGRRVVGAGIDFELARGEAVCVLGPNGAGKSTLLRTLLGLLPPLKGSVLLDGREIGEWPLRERAMRLAYVPQSSESFFDFSVLETAELGRSAHRGVFGRPTRADRDAAMAQLERLGIGAIADRPIHRVSGGERQLALIARALASGATTLVMDEPTANLDFANQARILEAIAALRAGGGSVIFSTHHPDHALRAADRALLLRGGRALAVGAVAATLNSANLSALYGVEVEVVEATSPDGSRWRTCRSRDGLAMN